MTTDASDAGSPELIPKQVSDDVSPGVSEAIALAASRGSEVVGARFVEDGRRFSADIRDDGSAHVRLEGDHAGGSPPALLGGVLGGGEVYFCWRLAGVSCAREASRPRSSGQIGVTPRASGIGDMTPHNPDSFIDLSTVDTDFGRPKAVVHLGNAKASPQDFPGSAQTQNDRTTWDAMDAVSDRIALMFAGNEPFDILASGTRVIPVPAGTKAQRLAALAAFKGRRDDLGTTHHDAGTMRMGDSVADSVTNDFGRIHDTTNCYVAGPALFPTVGSPNPMLTRVAFGRRTAFLLNENVLPGPAPVVSPQSEAGFRPLFDGTAATFKNWRLAGPLGGGMLHSNGEMVSYGDGGLRLFYYAVEKFGNFTLRLQFRIIDVNAHNSGVFIRFPSPTLDFATDELKRRAGLEGAFDPGNPAWKPVVAGFEIQIDDSALGDSGKDFYGIKPEPNGLFKNRTGAIYKIQAGDRIWHLNAKPRRWRGGEFSEADACCGRRRPPACAICDAALNPVSRSPQPHRTASTAWMEVYE